MGNPYYNESFVFLVEQEQLRRVNLELIVADYDRIGSSDPIGKVLLGYNRKGLEIKHWKEMIENPRRPIVHWHVLKDPEPGDEDEDDKDKKKDKSSSGTGGSTDPNNKRKESIKERIRRYKILSSKKENAEPTKKTKNEEERKALPENLYYQFIMSTR